MASGDEGEEYDKAHEELAVASARLIKGEVEAVIELIARKEKDIVHLREKREALQAKLYAAMERLTESAREQVSSRPGLTSRDIGGSGSSATGDTSIKSAAPQVPPAGSGAASSGVAASGAALGAAPGGAGDTMPATPASTMNWRPRIQPFKQGGNVKVFLRSSTIVFYKYLICLILRRLGT